MLHVNLDQERVQALEKVMASCPSMTASEIVREAVERVTAMASGAGPVDLSSGAWDGLGALAALLGRDPAAVAQECVMSIAEGVAMRRIPRIVEELRLRVRYAASPLSVKDGTVQAARPTQSPPSLANEPQSVRGAKETPTANGPDEAKRRIIEQIRTLHARRFPLNITAVKRHSPELMSGVYEIKPYWGWRAALEEAGLSYDVINTELSTECVCRICGNSFGKLSSHLFGGHGLTREDYLNEYPGAELTADVHRVFWHRYTPPLPHWEKVWTPEYILDRIATYGREGVTLHVNSMTASDPALFATVWLQFPSWDEALARAGVDPERVRRLAPSRHISRQEVLAELRRRWEAGLPLHATFEEGNGTTLASTPQERKKQNEYLQLIGAARRHFGGYREALEAAGIAPDQVLGRRYTQEDVAQAVAMARTVAAIPEHHKRARVATEMHQTYTKVVNVRFGSWRKLAKEVGIEPWRLSMTPYPVAQAALEGLSAYIRAGNPLVNYTELWQNDSALSKAVSRRLGTFETACNHLRQYLMASGAAPDKLGAWSQT